MPPPKRRLGLLLTIVALGLFLRLVWLSDFPPSLNWDEASLGYNAYSLLKTGHDEWGVAFPAIFRAFGDYKLPGYVYLAVPAVKLFGLTVPGVRLPSALAGTMLIFVTYLLARAFFSDTRISLLASFLVAVEPWTWFLSRVALEANLAALLIALGLLFILRRQTVWAVFFLGLSVWTYNSARLFVPILLLSFWLILRRLKLLPIHYLLLTIFFLPMFFQLLSPVGLARFNWVSPIDQGAVNRINELRSSSQLPAPLSRLIYNRPSYLLFTITINYFGHFSPDFLFLKGGSHYQFNIPRSGLLSVINLPLFYLGIFLIFKSGNVNHKPLLILWLFLAPLPGSLTRDAPHTLRAMTLLPAPMLVISFAAVTLWQRLKKFSLQIASVYIIILFLSLVYYFITLIPVYRSTYSWAWQYGFKEAVSYVKAHYDEYDRIIITKKYGEPHIFFLFYWPVDPVAYQSDPGLVRYFRSDWYWVDSFAKFRFVNDWEMKDIVSVPHPGEKYLIVAGPENIPAGTVLSQISFLDGSPAFIIKEL